MNPENSGYRSRDLKFVEWSVEFRNCGHPTLPQLSLMPLVCPCQSLGIIHSPIVVCSACSRYLNAFTFADHREGAFRPRTRQFWWNPLHLQICAWDSSQVWLGPRRRSSRTPVHPWTTFCSYTTRFTTCPLHQRRPRALGLHEGCLVLLHGGMPRRASRHRYRPNVFHRARPHR